MLDDEDGKIRRNLVLTSMLILAVSLLGLQPLKLLEDALKSPAPTGSQWKAWGLTLATQLYLLARYHYSPKWFLDTESNVGADHQKPIYRTVTKLLKEKRPEALRWVVRRQIWASRNVKAPGRFRSLHRTLHNTVTGQDFRSTPVKSITEIVGVSADALQEHSTWTGAVTASYTARTVNESGGEGSISSGVHFEYSATTSAKIQTLLIALVRAFFFSQGGISIAFPYLLGVAALLAAILQFVLSFCLYLQSGHV